MGYRPCRSGNTHTQSHACARVYTHAHTHEKCTCTRTHTHSHYHTNTHYSHYHAPVAGVAPQSITLNRDDLGNLALAVASIGSAYRHHATANSLSGGSSSSSSSRQSSSSIMGGGSAEASVAEDVPEWVASLARLLSRKARQQLHALQPWQVAAVMSMVSGVQMIVRWLW